MRKLFFSRFDLLLVHLIITALLTGVIWILQVLYFPSMKGWQKESESWLGAQLKKLATISFT